MPFVPTSPSFLHFRYTPAMLHSQHSTLAPRPAWHWSDNAAPGYPEQQQSPSPLGSCCATERGQSQAAPHVNTHPSHIRATQGSFLLPLGIDQNSHPSLFSCCFPTGLLSRTSCLGTCCITISSILLCFFNHRSQAKTP